MRSILPKRLHAVTLPALFAGAELAWAYLWLGWFCHLTLAQLSGPALSWPLALAVLALSVAITRTLLHSSLGERRTGWIVLVSGVVVIVAAAWLSYRHALPDASDLLHLPDRLAGAAAADIALVFGAFLWWRGIVIARDPLHFEDASFRLAFGIAALTVALALGGASGSTLGRGAIALLVLEFFACILPALAIARLRDIRAENSQSDGDLGLRREWLGVMGLIVAAILVLATLFASATSADLARLLGMGLNWAADGLYAVLFVVLLPVAFLVAGAIYLARAIIALLTGGHTQPFQPPSPSDLQPNTKQSGSGHLSPALATSGKWVLLALVVIAVLAIIVRAVFRYQRMRGTEIEEIHESVWPGGSVLLALLDWLRGLLRRLRPAPAAPPADAGLAPEPAGDPQTLSVRAAYRNWLRAAASLGRPPRPPETPGEFLAPSLALLPDAAPDLLSLTRAYEAARYGAPPAGELTVAAARTAWERIEQRLAPPEGRNGA